MKQATTDKHRQRPAEDCLELDLHVIQQAAVVIVHLLIHIIFAKAEYRYELRTCLHCDTHKAKATVEREVKVARTSAQTLVCTADHNRDCVARFARQDVCAAAVRNRVNAHAHQKVAVQRQLEVAGECQQMHSEPRE